MSRPGEPETQAAGRVSEKPPAVTGTSADASTETPQEKVSRSDRVVLIVVDTLRADRLGCYEYEEQSTTPTMDRLAIEGIVFEDFHAASPWTGASFGSILTGVSPTVHGAGKRAGKRSKHGKSILGVRTTPLSCSVPTIPQAISDITSAAVVTNSFLHPKMGFARGFDHYDHQNADLSKSRRADATTKAAINWLSKTDEDRFFLMVHYFDPHISYDPPRKYLARFAPGPSGRLSAPFSDHSRARNGTLKPTEDEKRFIRGLYNGEVRFVDDQIGELVRAMDGLKMLDNTWIAVTADHGDEQFDHGSFDHGHRFEEEVTRVPLIIRPPGGKWRAGTRIAYSARHIDIAPTILEWFGQRPAPQMSGRSLMPLITGVEKRHRPAYMEFNIYWGERCALYDGRFKLIRGVYNDRSWMYDLEIDPLEKKKLGTDHPQYKRLEDQLFAVRKRLDKLAETTLKNQVKVRLPPEVEESLRSLGYIE